jgi:hypothetical protein
MSTNSFSGKQLVSKAPLVDKLLEANVDRNKIAVPRAFIRFLGSLEAAAFLNQLLYWYPRAGNPEKGLYKSDGEWSEELGITRYRVREVCALLRRMGIVTTRVRRANGSPTLHYKCDLTRLSEMWNMFARVPEETWRQMLAGFLAKPNSNVDGKRRVVAQSVA